MEEVRPEGERSVGDGDPADRNAQPDEECFYDCQEALKPSDLLQEESGARGAERSTQQELPRAEEVPGGVEKEPGGVNEEEPGGGEEVPGGVEEEPGGAEEEVPVGEEEEEEEDSARREEEQLSEEEKQGRKKESLLLKERGNTQFKCGEHHAAEQSYTEALGVCPLCCSQERAVLFSNRAAARMHLDKKKMAIADCTKALALRPDYVRALLRRAELLEQTDKLEEALQDYQAALERDPGQGRALDACRRLPQQIHERNERLKEEMMGKLKDLGDVLLRPFGLSTRNFQLNQNEGGAGYSINFVQKPNNNT